MDSVIRAIDAHPKSPPAQTPLRDLVVALNECAATCTVCADACLSEPDVSMLAECIALNELCADVCTAAGRLAARVGHHRKSVMTHQLQACQEACRLCAEECERHEHEHCRVCAESCRRREEACGRVLEVAVAH